MDGARRGLAAGLITQYEGLDSARPGSIWAVATIPVVVALALSILRDFLIGHFSVDAIALISRARYTGCLEIRLLDVLLSSSVNSLPGHDRADG